MPGPLTVIVHGTYAAGANWWLPGTERDATFADRLEAALAANGLAGTVWAPAAAAGVDPRGFAWSGENSHAARMAGAENLAARLTETAARLGATAADPLVVHFVAHSHGGNVVLAAMPRLPAAVRCGEIVMLGTPLLACQPALRPFRLLLALSIFGISVTTAILLGVLLLTGPEADEALGSVVALAVMPLLSGWLCLSIAFVADWCWAAPILVARALRGRPGGPCYGPGARRLRRVLAGRKILLVISRFDEAELLLDLGAAPLALYDALLRRRTLLRRIVHWVVLRPIVYTVLEAVETLLERWVLGFSWWQVLFFDHAPVRAGRHGAYPADVIDREDVTRALRKLGRAQALAAPVTLSLGTTEDLLSRTADEEGRLDVGAKLDEAKRYFESQLWLRHSLYYESPAVIELIAARLAPPEAA